MFDKRNIQLFGLGIVLLVIGYVCLGIGPVDNPISMSVAPVILVAVYCVFFPWALTARRKQGNDGQDDRGV